MSAQRVLCVVISLFAVGCSTINTEKIGKTMGFKSPDEVRRAKYGEAVRLAAVWSPNMLTGSDEAPTRGFGGRIFFYNNRNQPIPVVGELVVYAYDDTDPNHKNRIPDKRLGFSAEKFATHYSEGELGASYSVWIPWDQNLQKKQRITLIPVFITKTGHKIHGQPTKVELAGRDDGLLHRPAQKVSSGVQQVQHVTPVKSAQHSARIPLSDNIVRHLRASANQPTLQALTPEARQLLNDFNNNRSQLVQRLMGQTSANLPPATRGGTETNGGVSPITSPFQIQNHFGIQPYSSQQFNARPDGMTTSRPASFRPIPQLRVPHFEPRIPPAQAWQRVRQASVGVH
jgi:hypothetical protein